jgi:FADH2-dependent halogenase
MSATYDAIVIGGGPGGSAAATLLARHGRGVLVLEKERFPRFHIGESLLPYNTSIFEEMGVLPALEAAGFPIKLGAQFHLGNSSRSLLLTFRNGCYTRHLSSIQVERSRFDDILLKHTAASGAEVREGWTVNKYSNDTHQVSVTARDAQGKTETFHASFLIDASGRGNFTGNQEKLRIVHPDLKKLSVFGHFEGVVLDAGDKKGDTVIFRLEDKWFWLIPLSDTKVSVGCVMDQQEFLKAKEDPGDLFERIWKSSSALRERMENARLVGSMQTTSDFSYHNRRLVGPRLLRIGDAAGFMDPIFSAGVYLAMYSGRLAAQAVEASLVAGDDGVPRLKHYEKKFFQAMRYYSRMVEGFYTRPFMEIFIQPREKFRLTDAIVAILAGELEGGWRIEWRRRLFFALVKIQSWRKLVPALSFKDSETERVEATL